MFYKYQSAHQNGEHQLGPHKQFLRMPQSDACANRYGSNKRTQRYDFADKHTYYEHKQARYNRLGSADGKDTDADGDSLTALETEKQREHMAYHTDKAAKIRAVDGIN